MENELIKDQKQKVSHELPEESLNSSLATLKKSIEGEQTMNTNKDFINTTSTANQDVEMIVEATKESTTADDNPGKSDELTANRNHSIKDQYEKVLQEIRYEPLNSSPSSLRKFIPHNNAALKTHELTQADNDTRSA